MKNSIWAALRTALAIFLLIGVMGVAFGSKADQMDESLIPNACRELPYSAGLSTFSRDDNTTICDQMLRVMEGVRVKDFKIFAKVVYLLKHDDYRKGYTKRIAFDLAEIIRLRGLYDQPDRWAPTLNICYKVWAAFHGNTTPADIADFLVGAGPDLAKSMSDEGFTKMIIVVDMQKRQGN